MASGKTFYDTKTETFLPGARCNIEQYRILQRCSEAKDISEWNQWRKKHWHEDIWLCGANLREAHLDGADLREAHLDGANLRRAHLDGANLYDAHLDGANLCDAHLDGANLYEAYLDGADLRQAHLDGADLLFAHLDGTNLWEVHLDGAVLWYAHLDGAVLSGAHLDGADLSFAYLDGADLSLADLRGASFCAASVDGTTILWGNLIDRKTNFTGVGLADARVEPGLKQLLEYNVRRIGWRNWYKTGPWWLKALKRGFVQPFWCVSDYGRATGRIGVVFFAFAAIFALVYRLCPQCLMVRGEVGAVRGFLHAFYFSVVTQTTLGFGDIHANPASPYGQLLLMLQVLLGYVLLGALVTRFAVLFTAGGPAGRFSPKPKKKRRKDEA